MPAAERQIASAVLHSVRVRSILKVLLVSAGDEVENDHFMSAFGHSANVTVVSSLTDMQLHLHENDHYDALILNRVLVHENALNSAKILETTLSNVLRLLKLGGTLIVREDLAPLHNVNLVAKLTDIFDVYRSQSHVGFDFYSLNSIDDSIYAHQNWLDVFWTLTKRDGMTDSSEYGAVTMRDFLDRTQYTDTGIGAYEWIFGAGFISPGGADENLKFLKRLHHANGEKKMLDIGVGLGGSPRQAARELGLHVIGIDLSSNMLSIALGRAHQAKDARVRFQITDALKYNFHADSFDFVYSRDCIQHMADIAGLFHRIFKWLKPGGQMLITMYGKGHGELTQKFKEYVKQRHYFLYTLEEIGKWDSIHGLRPPLQLAKDAGFVDVETENLTPRFKEILEYELQRTKTHAAEFLDKFDETKLEGLIAGWTDKLHYIADDNHNWNLIQATKPHRDH